MKMFKCPFCDKQYNSNSGLGKHQLSKHPIEYVKLCDERTKQPKITKKQKFLLLISQNKNI